ncbi:co-chaperonin GroES [Vibrio phage D81]
MSENIRPLSDHVFIRRQEYALQSDAGILLNSISVKKPTTGIVVAAGKGVVSKNGTLRPLDVKEGDRVIFEECFSHELREVNGEELLVMREDKVLAVIVKTQEECQ